MYEQIFNKVINPLYETVLRRRNTLIYAKEYESNQWLSLNELETIQWKKLKELLFFCSKNVAYYKKLWDSEGISPHDVKTMSDFEKLPILTKGIIRENYNDLISDPYRGRTLTKSTGGSTGIPLSFEYTRESFERRNAVMLRGYAWAGSRLGRKTSFVWGGSIGDETRIQVLKEMLHNKLLRRQFLNSFIMSKTNLIRFVEKINKYNPQVLVGYVNPVYTLAKFIKSSGIKVHSPDSIITGAEPLMSFQRKDIEEAFGCSVFNTYGCREFMLMASECEKHNGLHINIDHLILETVDEKNNGVIDLPGDIAITDLHNYGMPFIRYVNGDVGIKSKEKCTCGRALPILKSVEGRKLDAIKTIDGRILPGEFFPRLMRGMKGVERYQFVQEKIDKLVVKLVKNEGFDQSSINYINNKIKGALGNNISVNIRFVDEIELTMSGKYRVAISQLEEDS